MTVDTSVVKRAVFSLHRRGVAATTLAPGGQNVSGGFSFSKDIVPPFPYRTREAENCRRATAMERWNDGTARHEAPEDAALSVPLYVPSPLIPWNGR